jgi:DNA repair ATPase RecN
MWYNNGTSHTWRRRLLENEKFQELVVNQLATLTSMVQGLDSKVDNLENGLDKLAFRMEKEVIDKLKALFDARDVRNERLKDMDERLENVETDVRYLVSRVTRLEKVAK